jgi:uncharacterized protein YjbI with pentapeptide repeats
MSRLQFRGANFDGANLREADLSLADLGPELDQTTLLHTDLTQSVMYDVELQDAIAVEAI